VIFETTLVRTAAVGVVVPVHNEQKLLGASLASLVGAFDELRQWNLSLKIAVVLDSCSDASQEVALQWQQYLQRSGRPLEISLIACHAKNVGFARALGCSTLLAQWATTPPSSIWLATTDADSQVPKDWLVAQVSQHEAGIDHWSGRVAVCDWADHRRETRLRWQAEYERESHPIHGASLGFNAAAYVSAGGFKALKTGEDRALHRAFLAQGSRAHYDSATRVVTSARRRARAPFGFAHALEVMSNSLRARATG
jgi:glycosyltransferase involved in cell wall biosynthesis